MTALITSYIAKGAGAPSGSPGIPAGENAVYIDETNNQVYFWNSTSSAWRAAHGSELGYVSGTSSTTTTSLTYVDVTGMTLTVTMPAGPCTVEFFCSLADFSAGVSSGRFEAQLYDVTAAASVDVAYVAVPSSGGGMVHVIARVNPGAGSRQYKVRMQSESGSQTARLYADASSPMWLRITA